MHSDQDPRARHVAAFFENLTPASLATLALVYDERAHFKDPFNDVKGLDGIRAVFEHMFTTTVAPRFEVIESVTQGDQAWLTWNFYVQRGHDRLCIHGASQLRFGSDGRVLSHRDYWDPAQELYAKLPVLGPLVRWLTRRLSATA